MRPLQTTSLEENTSGFTVEHRPDGIIVYRVRDFSTATINAWLRQAELEDQLAFAAQRPICTLTDICNAGYPTPYALRELNALARRTPLQLREAAAIIVNDTGIFSLVVQLIRYLPDRYHQGTHFFTLKEQEKAIAWLLQRRRELEELQPDITH